MVASGVLPTGKAFGRKRADKSEEDEDGPGEDDESNDEEVDNVIQHCREKGKRKTNKKPGRKPRWCPKSLDDLIDIIVNSTNYKTKLIFTNTKNQKNGPIYVKILEELEARASARGDKLSFTVNQLRTKFKKCISCCKQAALTVKTATGIKRFQEDRGYGKWFNALFEVVKTRDSCQPELALEPSSSGTCSSNKSFDDTDHIREDASDGGLFVPKRNVMKVQSSKHKVDSVTSQVMKVVEDVVNNDPTRDLINFMREEMEKSRQHEMKLFELMLNYRASGSYGHCFDGVPPSSSMAYGTTGFYPTWQSGGGQSHVNQAFLPESSSGSPFPFDSGKYQPL
ncbi:uncharacterized protein [Montipora foliosa]|uniref:uncharacterized protein isoform X2 n=1 Tax=Montipora foliosa TaxID=591990 RepID=UPI0035F10879